MQVRTDEADALRKVNHLRWPWGGVHCEKEEVLEVVCFACLMDASGNLRSTLFLLVFYSLFLGHICCSCLNVKCSLQALSLNTCSQLVTPLREVAEKQVCKYRSLYGDISHSIRECNTKLIFFF